MNMQDTTVIDARGLQKIYRNSRALDGATFRVERGRIGVSIQNLTPDLSEAFGLDTLNGALITSVERGSSAERAGLRRGDLVIALNGRDVRNSTDLRNRIGLVRVGDSVTVTIVRDGERRNVDLRVTAP